MTATPPSRIAAALATRRRNTADTPPAPTSASKTAASPTSKPSCSTMPTINNTTNDPARYPRHLPARDAKSQLKDITDATTVGQLECNPNGQWGWVEHQTGQPISRALADTLARGTKA